ncbi:MAG: 16S rRNA (uracil(1498)-N(3))-methyltransferase [Ahrensia sp.]
MRANYKLQRLFLDQPMGQGHALDLDKAQSNYLMNVLRMAAGDTVLVFNGRDGEWRATLQPVSKKTAQLHVDTLERAQSAAPDLHYCFAPLKVGRLDYMVQKAVEMGAGVLQPVLTQHTQNHRLNVDKMQANALEAAEQCGILALPSCREPLKFDAFLDGWDASRTLIFCDEDAATDNPLATLTPLKGKPIGLLIGPEGGFSDEERAQLRELDHVVAIPLGPRILRADTAAVAAMALVQAACGDW